MFKWPSYGEFYNGLYAPSSTLLRLNTEYTPLCSDLYSKIVEVRDFLYFLETKKNRKTKKLNGHLLENVTAVIMRHHTLLYDVWTLNAHLGAVILSWKWLKIVLFIFWKHKNRKVKNQSAILVRILQWSLYAIITFATTSDRWMRSFATFLLPLPANQGQL